MARELLTSQAVLPADRREGLLTCLQAGRAVAALFIILFHNALYIFAKDKYWGFDPAQGFLTFSHAGVEFFFVLSGFIILHIHWKDLGRPQAFLSFIRKRFLRIYPMYWVVLAFIVPVYFIVPSFGFPYHRELVTMISSVLLIFLNANQYSELPVAWTLHHEVLFYALFSVAIFSRRLGLAVLGVWLLTSAASLMMAPFAFPLLFIASPLHLLFAMGMLACVILRRGSVPAPALITLLGLAIFFGTGLGEVHGQWNAEDPRNLFYGLGSTLALIGLVDLERRGRLNVPAFLELMGDASYSIYLTHFTVLSLLAKLFIKCGAREHLPVMISFVALPLLTVLFGILVHLCVERPLLRALARGFKLRPVTTAQAA